MNSENNNKQLCLQPKNEGTFVKSYFNNSPCPIDSSIELNKLSRLLLESGIGIKYKNSGLHRLLKIIIQDLNNVVSQATASYQDIYNKKPILLGIIGGESTFNEIKNFLNAIIDILKNITSKKDLIDLVTDLENPIIDAIKNNLMGGKNSSSSFIKNTAKSLFSKIGFYSKSNNKSNKYKTRARLLFEELLKHVFVLYVSPWGIQIHEECKTFDEEPELKKSITSIFKFFLSNTILGYIAKLSIKGIEQIPIDECINTYIISINKKIKSYQSCNEKCRSERSEVCIPNSLNKSKQLCGNSNIWEKSIIKQSQNGSYIAQLFIKSEFKNRNDTNLDMKIILGDILSYWVYDSPYSKYIPSELKGGWGLISGAIAIISNSFKSNIIPKSYSSKEDLIYQILSKLDTSVSSYNNLNCTLFNLNKIVTTIMKIFGGKFLSKDDDDFIKDIVYKYIIDWGIIPLCSTLVEKNILTNNSKKINNYKILSENNVNLNKNNFKGDCSIHNNIMKINLVYSNNNVVSYYYSSSARSYIINKKFNNFDETFYNKIFARLNNINFLYVNYFKKANEYYIKLYPTIKYSNNEYNISVLFNNIDKYMNPTEIKENEDINNFINCILLKFTKKNATKSTKETIYKLKDDYNLKKEYLDYINKSFSEGTIKVKLEEINTKSTYDIIINTNNINSKYVIPKSYLFGNTDLEYIVVQSNISGGSKKYIKNKVNKKVRSKLVSKNSKSKKIKKLK